MREINCLKGPRVNSYINTVQMPAVTHGTFKVIVIFFIAV